MPKIENPEKKEIATSLPILEAEIAADFDFLKELTEISACSGNESPITTHIHQLLIDLCDAIEIDAMGNLLATIHGDPGTKTVLIDAHADEIGFQVVLIEKEGFLRIVEIGGQNPRILPGARVKIHSSRGGDMLGIIGEKPIHFLTAEQRKKSSELSDLFVDVGLGSKQEVEKYIDVGDFITFIQKTDRFSHGTLATGKAFDDRAGCWVLIKVLQWIKKQGPIPVTVVGVFASQEELGLRGATTAAFKVDPDMAICLEVNHATDFPGAPKNERGDLSIGKGPIIPLGPNVHPKMSRTILQTARSKQIPFQTVALPRPAANDARLIQISRSGVPVGLITIPLRYMHTSIETLDIQDLHNTARLLYETLKQLDNA